MPAQGHDVPAQPVRESDALVEWRLQLVVATTNSNPFLPEITPTIQPSHHGTADLRNNWQEHREQRRPNSDNESLAQVAESQGCVAQRTRFDGNNHTGLGHRRASCLRTLPSLLPHAFVTSYGHHGTCERCRRKKRAHGQLTVHRSTAVTLVAACLN